jgi:D-glycero-alpha-D-manno-heptose 1-phosphate guanylyltransferase
MQKDLSKIQALILCGGLGKRLQSVTQNNQKVMAAVNDKPFLDILIGYLKSQGIQNIVLCAGYKAEAIEDYYRKNAQGLNIKFSTEKEPLGTGGAIKNARAFVESDPFFVLNGDSFCPVDLKLFLQYFYEKKAQTCLAVSQVDESKDFGGIVLNKNFEIVSFKEKEIEAMSYVNAGVYCFSKNIFNLMPKENKFSIEIDFFPKLIGQKFFGFIVDKAFYDIGTPERYIEAQKVFKKRGKT